MNVQELISYCLRILLKLIVRSFFSVTNLHRSVIHLHNANLFLFIAAPQTKSNPQTLGCVKKKHLFCWVFHNKNSCCIQWSCEMNFLLASYPHFAVYDFTSFTCSYEKLACAYVKCTHAYLY